MDRDTSAPEAATAAENSKMVANVVQQVLSIIEITVTMIASSCVFALVANISEMPPCSCGSFWNYVNKRNFCFAEENEYLVI